MSGCCGLAMASNETDPAADVRRVSVLLGLLFGLAGTGSAAAALALAPLARPVKKMIGGVTGWLDEGFELVTD